MWYVLLKKMPKSYSEDIRKKAIEYILLGHTVLASARKFDISETSVRIWYKRYLEEGHYRPKLPPGKVSKISNEILCVYVDANPDATLVQIGAYFGLTDATICYRLKKLGYRYKKKSRDIKKPVKRKGKNI